MQQLRGHLREQHGPYSNFQGMPWRPKPPMISHKAFIEWGPRLNAQYATLTLYKSYQTHQWPTHWNDWFALECHSWQNACMDLRLSPYFKPLALYYQPGIVLPNKTSHVDLHRPIKSLLAWSCYRKESSIARPEKATQTPRTIRGASPSSQMMSCSTRFNCCWKWLKNSR